MPATPNITLTATLQDITGAAVGSAANPVKLCIALCGFGAQLPRIGGTSMLARVGPMYLESATGVFTAVKLWGNDAITPAGTYYTISLIDGQGDVVQCAAYQLAGSGSFDLSNLVSIFPAVPIPSTGYIFVPSSTPVFNAGGWGGSVTFDMTLNANVTSSSLVNIINGQLVQFIIQQDGTGSRTFAWPANVKNPPLINPAANSVSTQLFIMRADGNLYPILGWS